MTAEEFLRVIFVIFGVALLAATALLLVIIVIVSIPTMCLIRRWVYSITSTLTCIVHVGLCVYCIFILTHLYLFRRVQRKRKVCVCVCMCVCVCAYNSWPIVQYSRTLCTITCLVQWMHNQDNHVCSNCFR